MKDFGQIEQTGEAMLIYEVSDAMPQSEFGVGNKVANHQIKARKAT